MSGSDRSPSVIVRPATREDIEAYSDQPGKPTIKAVALVVDDQVLGLGGVALQKGRWIGFVDLKPEARKYKTTIGRAAVKFLAQMRREGIRYIYVMRDEDEPRSDVWLASLGFEIDPRTLTLHRWKA